MFTFLCFSPFLFFINVIKLISDMGKKYKTWILNCIFKIKKTNFSQNCHDVIAFSRRSVLDGIFELELTLVLKLFRFCASSWRITSVKYVINFCWLCFFECGAFVLTQVTANGITSNVRTWMYCAYCYLFKGSGPDFQKRMPPIFLKTLFYQNEIVILVLITL